MKSDQEQAAADRSEYQEPECRTTKGPDRVVGAGVRGLHVVAVLVDPDGDRLAGPGPDAAVHDAGVLGSVDHPPGADLVLSGRAPIGGRGSSSNTAGTCCPLVAAWCAWSVRRVYVAVPMAPADFCHLQGPTRRGPPSGRCAVTVPAAEQSRSDGCQWVRGVPRCRYLRPARPEQSDCAARSAPPPEEDRHRHRRRRSSGRRRPRR